MERKFAVAPLIDTVTVQTNNGNQCDRVNLHFQGDTTLGEFGMKNNTEDICLQVTMMESKTPLTIDTESFRRDDFSVIALAGSPACVPNT